MMNSSSSSERLTLHQYKQLAKSATIHLYHVGPMSNTCWESFRDMWIALTKVWVDALTLRQAQLIAMDYYKQHPDSVLDDDDDDEDEGYVDEEEEEECMQDYLNRLLLCM